MLTNNELKYYASLKQKKIRESEKKFLIEGKHLVEECLSSSFRFELLIVDEKKFDDEALISKAKNENIKVEKITTAQLKKVSDTETPQGIIGVVKMKKPSAAEVSDIKLVIALDAVNDPGNLGTITRTAYWYGVDAILLGERSVDIYNSKVIRSSQGAIFHVNFTENVKLLNELKTLKSSGFSVYVLTTHTNKYFKETDINEKAIFLFGNEAGGVSEDLLKAGFENVRIESYSNCESLNVGVSVGIALDRYRSSKH